MATVRITITLPLGNVYAPALLRDALAELAEVMLVQADGLYSGGEDDYTDGDPVAADYEVTITDD